MNFPAYRKSAEPSPTGSANWLETHQGPGRSHQLASPRGPYPPRRCPEAPPARSCNGGRHRGSPTGSGAQNRRGASNHLLFGDVGGPVDRIPEIPFWRSRDPRNPGNRPSPRIHQLHNDPPTGCISSNCKASQWPSPPAARKPPTGPYRWTTARKHVLKPPTAQISHP
jgi:hypothetical protein